MAEQKFVKVGTNGNMIPVEDCYSFIYDHGDGRTVLRVKIKDTDITVTEILELFNNEANVAIYEYKLVTPINYSIPGEEIAPATPAEPSYELVGMHEDYCKDMSYEYGSHVFSIEIVKKLAEEKLSEQNTAANNEIMMAIADMYAL